MLLPWQRDVITCPLYFYVIADSTQGDWETTKNELDHVLLLRGMTRETEEVIKTKTECWAGTTAKAWGPELLPEVIAEP